MLQFGSKEFLNLYELVKQDYPQLNEYLFYLSLCAYDQHNNQSNSYKNQKKNKKKKLPEFEKPPQLIDEKIIGAVNLSNSNECNSTELKKNVIEINESWHGITDFQ